MKLVGGNRVALGGVLFGEEIAQGGWI